MARNVDLISYLPPFVAEFKEITAALKAENPEFDSLQSAANNVLQNEFIETCDEYGVSRFEKMLGILPDINDNLAARRNRVMMRWNSTIPYTYKSLIEKLTVICGEDNFALYPDWESYSIKVVAAMPNCGQVEELNNLLEYIIPANIIVFSENRMCREYGNSVYVGTFTGECIMVAVNSQMNSRVLYNQQLNELTSTATHITCVVN